MKRPFNSFASYFASNLPTKLQLNSSSRVFIEFMPDDSTLQMNPIFSVLHKLGLLKKSKKFSFLQFNHVSVTNSVVSSSGLEF